MTDPRIQAALKAIEGATPGPWRIAGYAGEHDESGARLVGPSGHVMTTPSVYGDNSREAWRKYRAMNNLLALSPVLPAALRLLEAVEDAMGRHQVSHIHAVLREPLAEFLALLPAVPEGNE